MTTSATEPWVETILSARTPEAAWSDIFDRLRDVALRDDVHLAVQNGRWLRLDISRRGREQRLLRSRRLVGRGEHLVLVRLHAGDNQLLTGEQSGGISDSVHRHQLLD